MIIATSRISRSTRNLRQRRAKLGNIAISVVAGKAMGIGICVNVARVTLGKIETGTGSNSIARNNFQTIVAGILKMIGETHITTLRWIVICAETLATTLLWIKISVVTASANHATAVVVTLITSGIGAAFIGKATFVHQHKIAETRATIL